MPSFGQQRAFEYFHIVGEIVAGESGVAKLAKSDTLSPRKTESVALGLSFRKLSFP